jgi:Zn-dependent peptidase ImmA (M78 family)
MAKDLNRSPRNFRGNAHPGIWLQLDYETIGQFEKLPLFASVFVPGHPPRLLLNGRLYQRQIKFLLARELGYQYLNLQERSQTSTPDEVHSFQQLLNDFRAAYFGGALLMPAKPLLADLEAFFALYLEPAAVGRHAGEL